MKSPQPRPFARSEAFMLAKRDGTICCATPLASRWLQEHFRVDSQAKRLPRELRRWLGNPGRKPGQCKPFTKQNEHARLVVSLLRDEADGSFVLLFQEHELDAPHTRVRHHGITVREDEVLEAMAAGKTNAEIARALDIKNSTVKRHVEHILEKYHVDRRSAAVAVWQETRRKSHDNK
jgi:DNA-binding CsgD family transcriptional regulator